MSKILVMDAYVARQGTHENVESLGRIKFGICVDAGLSSLTGTPFPEGDYDFFTRQVDDPLAFGGAVCTIEAKSIAADFLKSYCPMLSVTPITTAEDLSTLEIKLVNSAGEFATKALTTASSREGMALYNADGTSMGTSVPLSCDLLPVANTIFNPCWLFVSAFTDPDEKFSDDQILYSFGVQSNRYWGKTTLSRTALLKTKIINFLNNIEKYTPPSSPDPYDDAGDSGPGGGEGTFDYTGNPPGGWDPSFVPDINATDTGFVTLFNPTIAELQTLSNYLWSSAFDLNTFKKIFNDPMELFIGLSIVPVSVPDGGRKQVGIGLINTGVYMTLAGTQWVTVDCGTLNVLNFTGSYLDYDPYTRVEIYLPFIGVRTLKADEVSGKAVHVGYWVDLLSGACVAWIDINNVPMYQFMGQCATSIPMASGEWTSLINGIIGAVGAVASGAAAGGVGGAIAGGVAAASSVAVNDSKIQVERSGAITSAAGLVALQMPVLYISAPNLHKPANQNVFEGYPAYYTSTLADVSGYTTIESIRLQGIPATEPELEEIETLLKGGVIL